MMLSATSVCVTERCICATKYRLRVCLSVSVSTCPSVRLYVCVCVCVCVCVYVCGAGRTSAPIVTSSWRHHVDHATRPTLEWLESGNPTAVVQPAGVSASSDGLSL